MSLRAGTVSAAMSRFNSSRLVLLSIIGYCFFIMNERTHFISKQADQVSHGTTADFIVIGPVGNNAASTVPLLRSSLVNPLLLNYENQCHCNPL